MLENVKHDIEVLQYMHLDRKQKAEIADIMRPVLKAWNLYSIQCSCGDYIPEGTVSCENCMITEFMNAEVQWVHDWKRRYNCECNEKEEVVE